MPDTARFYAKVHGRVQGVTFRYHTITRAQALHLTGYARNCWNGTVEVVAEGDREALGKLLSWLHEGPPAARVKRVESDWQQPQGEFTRFEVRF